MAASSSSSSSDKKYDVFLSFRGPDTRRGFTGYLYEALCQNSIHTYKDDRTLESGHEISPTLKKAIQESKICIIVLSENFASSTWCLGELVHILKCKRNDNGTIVIPIFYDIDPSIVRKQLGSYAVAFGEHEQRFRNEMEKVQQWRVALEEVANLSGHDSKNFGPECELVQTVVKDVSSKLHEHKYQLTDCRRLFGIEEPVKTIESYLSLGSKGVRMIGIWGMGGIGKTTLSRIVLQKFACHFDACCLIKDNQKAGDDLRYDIFRELFKDENLLRTDALAIGSSFIQDRLRRHKVFIVLDNLNGNICKLRDLFDGYQFANGSRIIITSRDKQLLQTVDREIYELKMYKLKGLDHRDALQLFCFHAFGPQPPATGYEALIESFVRYAKGNPLALKVFGSSLKSKRIEEWDSKLDQLKTYSDPNIQEVLKISFDGLGNNRTKGIFLDMACFFTGIVRREYVESILNHTEHSDAAIEISALIDKSLLEEEWKWQWEYNSVEAVLEMHDLLRQMGQGIVLDEDNNNPGNRSRLWNINDVRRVLEKSTGTSKIESISLNLDDLKNIVNVSRTAFSNMGNLRFLKITHFWAYEEVCKRLSCPNGLDLSASDVIRYFHWDFYPLKYLPDDLRTDNLVVLIMRHSKLERLWNQPLELEKLKKIDLSSSMHLIQIPNLSWAINLQDICLHGCTSLVHIPPFFQNLNKLWSLNMTNCKNLEDGIENLPNSLTDLRMGWTTIKSLPASIWESKYLAKLDLSGCMNLRKISEISNHMECLVEISLRETEIEELPESIENLTVLRRLNLKKCHKIKFLPNSLCKLLHLQWLILARCSSLEELPPLPDGLAKLDIRKCERLKSIAELPSSLSWLLANDCTSLETISCWRSPPKPSICDSGRCYNFVNCLKLDENTRNNVIGDLECLVLRLGQDDVWYCNNITYPGYEIPEWFSYQNDGGNSINNIHLPENWFELPLRFVFCIVFHVENDYRSLGFDYEFNFKTNASNSGDCLYSYGCSHCALDLSVGRYDGANDSNHVFICLTVEHQSVLSEVFGPNWSSIRSDISEASFQVSWYSGPMVKKCGFQFCNADKSFEGLNVDRSSSNQPNGRKHNGDPLPHNNSKRIKLNG